MAPVAEKAQQEPQLPWSFTGVTAPFSLQSIEGSGVLSRCTGSLRVFGWRRVPTMREEANSVFVMSAKRVIPSV